MGLDADAKRLAEWRQWLKAALKAPTMITQATPVCGAWQLQFLVHNLAPAVQKVVVEQQTPDGSWHELASRYTIEFRAQAARPASKIKREFNVPVVGPALKLRIALEGVGQLAISHAKLTDGVEVYRDHEFRSLKTMGKKAPRQGLPDIATPARAGANVVPLRFDRSTGIQ